MLEILKAAGNEVLEQFIAEEKECSLAERMKKLRDQRIAFGVKQSVLAEAVGIDVTYLSKLESGKKQPSERLLMQLEEILGFFNPEKEMEILFDYVRIRFPTIVEKYVIETIMCIKTEYMIEESHAFYGYSSQYVLGDIVVMVSADHEKGTLLELKGKGCRQFEAYLQAQKRSWYDFFRAVKAAGGVIKRLDIAINDRVGVLDIPDLAQKCRREECITLFHSFKDYKSGELIRHDEEDRQVMGNTLYLGSLRSEIYFCIYEKDYEQYVKNGIALEKADVKNRFEIRLKDTRAEIAMEDLLVYEDVSRTAFSIINHYVRFVDTDQEERRRDWRLNQRWAWFIGGETRSIKLTVKPEPYMLERTMTWLCRQVAPSLKMVRELDSLRGTNDVEEMIETAKLSQQHKKILAQQMVDPKEMIEH